MAGGVRKLEKNDILFKEGEPSDAMYVIKSGRIAITKAKGNSEIVLAELVAGEMLGEMAFFDNKPRSAGAKALVESEVIVLPFQALYAQFKTFPEWLKAMVKTVNSHLRNANQRIKNLETAQSGETEMFPPHTITRLCAILSFVGYKCGEKTEEGLVIPSGTLRTYTIQIFQMPTNKMQRLMEVLGSLGVMKVEDLGEGKQRVTILKHAMLSEFTDWYNEHIFQDEAKRQTVEEKNLPALRALIFYGKKETPDANGNVTVNLTEMQNNSMKDLNFLFNVNDADPLSKVSLTEEKQSIEGGALTMRFNLQDLERILPFWEIVYTLQKVPGR